jgi:hypothetical protein
MVEPAGAVLALFMEMVAPLRLMVLLLTLILPVVVDLGLLRMVAITVAVLPVKVVAVVLVRAVVEVAPVGQAVVLVQRLVVLMLVQACLARLVPQPVAQRLGRLLKMYLFGFMRGR